MPLRNLFLQKNWMVNHFPLTLHYARGGRWLHFVCNKPTAMQVVVLWSFLAGEVVRDQGRDSSGNRNDRLRLQSYTVGFYDGRDIFG